MTDKENDAPETAVPTDPEGEDTTVNEETEVVEADGEEAEEEIFVEDPQFDIDYKGECAYEVKVTIPPANRKKQSDEMFDELKHDAEVPGFRRGKVPMRLLERKFSKAVRGEVDSKLVNAAFQKLVKDNDLYPISTPDIDGLDEVKDLPDDAALAFTFKFEVSPRVELGKYRGIEVERPVVTVDDSDVQETIDDLRNRYAVFETLTDGAAEEGDQVIIDFKGAVDGTEFAGGSAESYPYILGTKRFFPEFEEALKGTTTGQETTCDVNFPDDYPNDALKGKTAQFAIKVNEIKRRRAPELNDEFAKQAGHENLADMQAKIRERLEETSKDQSRRMAESHALEAVIADSKFEVPKTLIEATTEETYQSEVRELLQMRLPMAEIRQREEEMRAHAREHALHDIQSLVVLNEIAEAEGIEVTEEDFEEEVALLAQRTGAESEAVANYLAESGRKSSYEARILRAKALKVIMDNAQITDKEIARDETEDAPKAE
ncbi:MAG: trigger factor [FCB group bacterium]|jgi:trigger factor|nr:trigger factor [FCB group bacterium]